MSHSEVRNKEIASRAAKVRQFLKGQIDFNSIQNYLDSINYTVVRYNTDIGDREIERYSLEETAATRKSFVYSRAAKIVFIDNKVPGADKLYMLCHELGHIELKHIAPGSGCNMSSLLMEIEADAFAAALIGSSGTNKRHIIYATVIVGAAAALMIGKAVFAKRKNNL